ncbi:MAG: hypothetical protein AAFS10_15890 [Myxococcota bacterium]
MNSPAVCVDVTPYNLLRPCPWLLLEAAIIRQNEGNKGRSQFARRPCRTPQIPGYALVSPMTVTGGNGR